MIVYYNLFHQGDDRLMKKLHYMKFSYLFREKIGIHFMTFLIISISEKDRFLFHELNNFSCSGQFH